MHIHRAGLATGLLAAAGLAHAAPYASPFPRQEGPPPARRASGGGGGGGGIDGATVLGFWGQGEGQLSDVCDSGFDVVVLSFITTFDPPTLDLAGQRGTLDADPSGLWGQVAGEISACQAKGVKVMIAFGGDTRYCTSTFASSAEATQNAQTVWDLFLGGTGSQGLRPFGSDVVLDGIDLDNEAGTGQYYPDFVQALRGLMGNSTRGGPYYISADPMAPEGGSYPDDASTSVPDSILPHLDWVNVQFYNAGDRSVGGSAFEQAVRGWGEKLAGVSPAPRLLVGIPGGPGEANDGILTAAEVADTLAEVRGWEVAGFAGVGIWDCGSAMANAGFLDSVRSSLAGGGAGSNATTKRFS